MLAYFLYWLFFVSDVIQANHCAGAVMFLIEGDAKAVLYTGDIRCRPTVGHLPFCALTTGKLSPGGSPL